MRKIHFVPVGLAAACALFFFGCTSGDYTEHVYWKLNPKTGYYARHGTLTKLSPEEVRELGFVEQLPENAKTVR